LPQLIISFNDSPPEDFLWTLEGAGLLVEAGVTPCEGYRGLKKRNTFKRKVAVQWLAFLLICEVSYSVLLREASYSKGVHGFCQYLQENVGILL
jgi:hypothetical protein